MGEARRRVPAGLYYAGAIETLRLEHGLTREALAEAAGVSPSYLSEVARGLKRPSTDVLARLAVALGMAPSALLAYVERISPERSLPRATPPDPGARAGAAFGATPSPRLASPALRRLRSAEHAAPDATEEEPAPGSRGQAIEALRALVQRLGDDDLRMLLELARRLERRGQ